jgi:ribonucleoside-triphosphate reductase
MIPPTLVTHFQAYLSSRTGLFKQVRKRDGRVVPFAPSRIQRAIARAGQATGEYDEEVALRLAIKTINLADQALDTELPSVEQIQDIVEEVLLASPFRKTARAFIIYRDQHARLRGIRANENIDLIEGYLQKLDWQVRENSNMAYSLQGLNNYISSAISQSYWLNAIYPSEVRDAHDSGDFHIHDLNQLSVYCVGWDLMDLLHEGFRGVPGKIEAKPAKHFRTALGQVINFFYTLQGEAAGAQAFSSFDTLLAPFIRYDGLSYAQVKQALQEFIFNINVPTRVGFQTPFTNVTLDLLCPKHLSLQPVIVGGEYQSETYSEFQTEMNTFNRAFFEVMKQGDAHGRIMTFPIPTINLTKDFDWDNPNLTDLWEITGKYGVPYFSNFINSDMNPDDARSMCCRLRIDNTQLGVRGGGLFGAHPLTGSVGVVTLNLPRLAYLAKAGGEGLAGFHTRLGNLLRLAKESLEIKRKFLESLTGAHLYPYTTYYLRHIKERSGKYWTNHFSTIGLVGMNEAAVNLIGETIGSEAGNAFAVETLNFMRAKLLEFQNETTHPYNLEATPAESTSYRLARKDKDRHPEILVANEEDTHQGAKPYYTNSSHLPVDYTDDLFETLDLQDELQTRYTGGTVLHLFLGERISDPSAVKNLVRRIASGYRLPYFSLTPTFSICPEHGYISGEHVKCPQCERECEVYSRVVGYLRPVSQWNEGKQAEFKRRRMLCVPSSATAAPGSSSAKTQPQPPPPSEDVSDGILLSEGT